MITVYRPQEDMDTGTREKSAVQRDGVARAGLDNAITAAVVSVRLFNHKRLTGFEDVVSLPG